MQGGKLGVISTHDFGVNCLIIFVLLHYRFINAVIYGLVVKNLLLIFHDQGKIVNDGT